MGVLASVDGRDAPAEAEIYAVLRRDQRTENSKFPSDFSALFD
jgi:hypothetical protein